VRQEPWRAMARRSGDETLFYRFHVRDCAGIHVVPGRPTDKSLPAVGFHHADPFHVSLSSGIGSPCVWFFQKTGRDHRLTEWSLDASDAPHSGAAEPKALPSLGADGSKVRANPRFSGWQGPIHSPVQAQAPESSGCRDTPFLHGKCRGSGVQAWAPGCGRSGI
jgi:hypothetical protein